ncbi:hypothetical protein MJH12_06520 [bacterium]|nr:hypothetical protein [bacterium]
MFKAFDIYEIKSHFDLIESILLDHGLKGYKVYDSSTFVDSSVRSGIIIVDGDLTWSTTNTPYLKYNKTLSICISPHLISVNDGDISLDALLQIKLSPSFSQEMISKICEFVVYLVHLVSKEREQIKAFYRNPFPNQVFSQEFLQFLLMDKGLEFEKIDRSKFIVRDSIEVHVGALSICSGITYDLDAYGSLGYHNDIRIENKFDMNLPIYPCFSQDRMERACDFIVYNIQELLSQVSV